MQAYGGLIFNRVPRLRERIPAYFLGETLDGAIHLIERLVNTPVPYPTVVNDDQNYQELVRLYREKRPLIEIGLFEALKTFDFRTEYMGDANYFFGNGLSAALELGDPSFLEADLEWVKLLLSGRRSLAGKLFPYLVAYRDSIDVVMGESGAPIISFIDSYIARYENTHNGTSSA